MKEGTFDVINTYYTHVAASRLSYTNWRRKLGHADILIFNACFSLYYDEKCISLVCLNATSRDL